MSYFQLRTHILVLRIPTFQEFCLLLNCFLLNYFQLRRISLCSESQDFMNKSLFELGYCGNLIAFDQGVANFVPLLFVQFLLYYNSGVSAQLIVTLLALASCLALTKSTWTAETELASGSKYSLPIAFSLGVNILRRWPTLFLQSMLIRLGPHNSSKLATDSLVVDVHAPPSMRQSGKTLWPEDAAEMVENIAWIMQKHLRTPHKCWLTHNHACNSLDIVANRGESAEPPVLPRHSCLHDS